MRRNKRQANEGPKDNAYDFYQGLNIESQTECTGMIPTPPTDDVQMDGYNDIYSVPQQCGGAAKQAKNAAVQKKKSSRPRRGGSELR